MPQWACSKPASTSGTGLVLRRAALGAQGNGQDLAAVCVRLNAATTLVVEMQFRLPRCYFAPMSSLIRAHKDQAAAVSAYSSIGILHNGNGLLMGTAYRLPSKKQSPHAFAHEALHLPEARSS